MILLNFCSDICIEEHDEATCDWNALSDSPHGRRLRLSLV